MTTPTTDGSGQCLKSIVEHWAESRIDGPMQAIARYDDAAKQLITIGGFLQGGLIAVYSVLGRQQHLSMSGWQIAGIVIFELSLILFLSFAAWACAIQPEMQARRISYLLKKAVEHCISEDDLVGSITEWCEDIEDIVKKKRIRMMLAKGLFIVCSAVMSVLLLFPLMPGQSG